MYDLTAQKCRGWFRAQGSVFPKLTHDHSGTFHQSGSQLQGILYAWAIYVGGIPRSLHCVTYRNITGGSDQGAYQRRSWCSGRERAA